MFGILNTDNYTSLHYNPKTGVNSREWIRYADNTFEPVRKSGNVNRKSRNKPGAPDWWVTERPLDWDPTEHGHEVTLNHDYGGKAKPAYDKDMENKPPEYSKLPYYETGRKSYAKMSDSGGGSEGSGGSEGGTKGGNEDPSGGSLDEEEGKSAKPGGTTLTQGSEGFWEMQAREKGAGQKAAKSGDVQAAGPPSSVQGARELQQWEREQGIDPNYGSGHERRPFSSSRDAAELEKRYDPAMRKEYIQSIKRYQDNPPWGKKVSPAEKVQNVSEPLAEELVEVMVEQLLKGSSNPWARAAGMGLKGLGPLADVLLSPGDAW